MTEQRKSGQHQNADGMPEERDGQRALDAASSEPRTLAQDERTSREAKMDAQATADETEGRRTDPSEDRATG